jgi:choline dehydrogenase
MAHHLSTYSNHTVLVIESGGIFSALSIMPLTSTLMQRTAEDWSFKTTPQLYSSFGLVNQVWHPFSQ